MDAEPQLTAGSAETASACTACNSYEAQIREKRLRNQRLLESLGIAQSRAVLLGKAAGKRSESLTIGEDADRPQKRGRRARSIAANAVAPQLSVQTRSLRRRCSQTETNAAVDPLTTVSVNASSERDADSNLLHGFLSMRASEKSPPSLGRYAFWEPIYDPRNDDASSIAETENHSAVKDHSGRLFVLSKKRVVSVRPNEAGKTAPKQTPADLRAEKRRAFESRFCADLPREPAPYALRRLLNHHSIAAFCCGTVAVPFTLRSIGVTVRSLGQLVIRPDDPLVERKWFSSRLAMYAHPFPTGYHATKTHWNRLWHMHIESDPNGGGPFFIVKSDDGRETYRRHTPSHAWMDACLHSHAPGTRISGPLFFGFSDPWLQTVIQTQLVADAEKSGIFRDSSTASECILGMKR
jgi:hypothetical protein